MAPKQRIRILKESLHGASKRARVSKRKRISKERLFRALKRARVSKRKGISKARKDLQKDPPTSSSVETTAKQQDSCSHPSSSRIEGKITSCVSYCAETAAKQQDSCSHPSSTLRVCDVCEALLPEFCGMPLEYLLEGITSTEDVLWFRP